jgi:phosphate transport system substrate-binding protein
VSHPSAVAVAVAALLVLAAACRDAPVPQSAPGATTARVASRSAIDLTGAGATFPYPVYSRWIAEYLDRTGVRINYQSIGSGGGIRQLSEGTVDFGASDSPMTAEEVASVRSGRIIHVPVILGAVAVTYNLPGVTRPLRLSGDVVADVFLGRIRRWNDPRIAALNPGVALPASDVLVVHRSDGSGTTYIFTDYLFSASRAWAAGPGHGKNVRWPVGMGGKGNEGVAGQVKQTAGSIGYVEVTYATQNRLPVAELRNPAGRFVSPSAATVTAAAEAATASLPPGTDYRVSIVDAPGEHSYPVASFSWILVNAEQPDTAKGRKIVDFLRWTLANGATGARALGYAPLPAAIARRVERQLDLIQVGATPAATPTAPR